MKWQDYQQEAAKFFRKLGLSASVEVEVEGARGVHALDVFVQGTVHGIKFKWAVECKAWTTNVPKEKVLAFASIIQDIGADRGFLLSEKGFQSGSIRVARKTNITLASLEDLAEVSEEQAADAAIGAMNWRLQKARKRLRVIKKASFDDYYIPPMSKHLGELGILEQVLQEAHDEGFPLLYCTGLEIKTLDELLLQAELVVSQAEQWQPPGQA